MQEAALFGLIFVAALVGYVLGRVELVQRDVRDLRSEIWKRY